MMMLVENRFFSTITHSCVVHTGNLCIGIKSVSSTTMIAIFLIQCISNTSHLHFFQTLKCLKFFLVQLLSVIFLFDTLLLGHSIFLTFMLSSFQQRFNLKLIFSILSLRHDDDDARRKKMFLSVTLFLCTKLLQMKKMVNFRVFRQKKVYTFHLIHRKVLILIFSPNFFLVEIPNQ